MTTEVYCRCGDGFTGDALCVNCAMIQRVGLERRIAELEDLLTSAHLRNARDQDEASAEAVKLTKERDEAQAESDRWTSGANDWTARVDHALRAENGRLREALSDLLGWDNCECGHPACKRGAAAARARKLLVPA